MSISGWGVIPFGTGFWGIPHPSAPPTNAFVNIINVNPSAGSFGIARNTTFTFTIQTKYTLNPNALYVFLDNQLVINGIIENPNFTIISTTNIDGISKDYSITPNYLFKDGDVMSLQISATDIYGNPAPPFFGGYIVLDSRPSLLTPIYPLNNAGDVPIDLTIHFLINQLAAPNSGLDSTTLNVYVNGSPAILGGFIQSNYGGEFSALNLPLNITDPFEVLLDSGGQYQPNEIETVNVSVKELGIIPVIGGNGNIYTPNGLLVAHNIIVSTINKLPNSQYDLILAAALTTYTLPSYIIIDGYQFQDTNGNTFNIAVVGVQEIIIGTPANVRASAFSFITGAIQTAYTTPVFAGYFQGVYLVDDLGDGYHIDLTWHSARTTRPDYDLAYLIYYSNTRSDVFFEGPKLITQGKSLPLPQTIKGADAQLFGFHARLVLPVGQTFYFGVRATEYIHTVPSFIPIDGYAINAPGLITTDDKQNFYIPTLQPLRIATGGSGAAVITIISTLGYANSGGYIIVGSEIMAYTSLTSTTFTIPSTGRGLFGSIIATIHNIGEEVLFFAGNFDDNTVIAKGLVSWSSPNDPHRTRPDLITTDFMLSDGYYSSFVPFDFCGYHTQRPDELFTDQTCNTYVGGEFNGERGLLLYQRELANEEMLLEVTGEPTILLRRLWSGETCICRTSRKDSARVRSCSICFGTGFRGGFVQYFNPRRNDQRIMIHFAPSDEDIGMKPQAGWDQTFAPSSWTLAIPALKDRDVLIRFDEFGEMSFIYIVDAVSRSKTVFGKYGRQKMKLSRLDRTDPVYQFKFIK